MRLMFKHDQSLVVLAVIFCLGAALRVYQIDFNPLWFDELFTWMQSGRKRFIDVWDYGVIRDTHPPIHITLLGQI